MLRLAALIGVVSMAVMGCGGKAEMEEQQLRQMEDRIRSWPSLEDTQRAVTAVSVEMAAALSARVPGFEFVHSGKPEPGSCGDYDRNRIGAVGVTIQALFVDRPIPDDAWSGVYDSVQVIAASYGFTDTLVLADKPGHHIVRFFDGTGNELTVGHVKATVISGKTGCRLKADSGTASPTTTR
ncbi:LppA family lipoprotein [Nocardia asteroides]|uniref:LppA family lipoprotein n=1 Tax=Nocardia asteroides TaxID=1824 RepID=UPI0037BC520B